MCSSEVNLDITLCEGEVEYMDLLKGDGKGWYHNGITKKLYHNETENEVRVKREQGGGITTKLKMK